ncbi:hypothetical protein Xbed_02570 [Xenorhabdus beddingii]|uniref:O-antigen polymerase n=1 Tax=Xenorhabdus beddingii TaxID=40578 RepID=A0A1Y2SNF6_9GAMM|nr:hypothetical protein [Xenorhabdus beddingii]OTA19173.1 hypothetical protein Xbed_02570 [Xenorhabdus beddingii]
MKEFIQFHKVNSLGYIWLIFCGFYLTKITALSPIYLSFLLITISAPLYLSAKKTIKIDRSFFSLSCMSLLFSFVILNSKTPLLINLFISLISPFLVAVFYKNKKAKSNILFFIFFSYALLFNIDGIWRVMNPDLTNLEKLESLEIGFQIYKGNSIMYSDSNYVGLQAVLFISVYAYLFKEKTFNVNRKIIYYTILILLLSSIILSFSRSATIGMCTFLFFHLLEKTNKLFFLVASILASTITIVFFSNHFSNDISYNSKFHILSITYDYLHHADIYRMLFGVGFGNAANVIGIGTHNLFITFLIESGLIGLMLFFLILIYFLKKLKYDFFIVVFPFILSSMSLGTTALPYFFTFICLCILKKHKKFSILP